MACQPARPKRRRTIYHLAVPAVTALTAAAVLCAPAVAGAATTIVVSGDTVVATSLASFGQTTIQATRPDALTGKPVVIGQYSASGNPYTPFSVNATTPTPISGNGDCWQAGALSRALTPDLQPGDTITLMQAGGFFGGPASAPITATVPPAGANTIPGPISGCSSIAPWARNAITSAPTSIGDGSLTVSGVAQPLATSVAVSASDGTTTSNPVSVDPAADGSWTATIPKADLAHLDDATLTVTPVVAVPDVSTGATAHIAGVAANVKKSKASAGSAPQQPAGGGSSGPQSSPGPTRPAPTGPRRAPRVARFQSTSQLSLASARQLGISVSFLVPAGATRIEFQLLHGSKTVYSAIVPAGRAGSQQTVRIAGSRVGRVLRHGRYTIAVKACAGGTGFGTARTRALVIR